MHNNGRVAAIASRCAIGIDVGGTKIAAGLVALDTGEVLTRRSRPTQPTRGGAAVLHDALELAMELQADAQAQGITVGGIGVGVAELVDGHGAITSAHLIAWQGLDVRAAFERLAPAVVTADVRAHALAEARYGAGRGCELFVLVSVGTGISSCLVQHGQPFVGARGGALVLASSPVTTTCTACGTTLQPVLEAIAAGPALVAYYNQTTGAAFTRAEQVVAAARSGDATAGEVVYRGGYALGVSIGWLVNVLDPQAIILAGGLGTAGGLYWEAMCSAAREHIWAESARDLPLIPASLGPDAGLIGAAAYVRDQTEGVKL